jgi:hypothetical protein
MEIRHRKDDFDNELDAKFSRRMRSMSGARVLNGTVGRKDFTSLHLAEACLRDPASGGDG